jgi:hypothetical protein
MKIYKMTAFTLSMAIAIFAEIPVGGFSNLRIYSGNNAPDIVDTSFRISPIEKSADPNDPDFRLEHRDERGRVRLYRGKDMVIFFDGSDYYFADGTHGMGSPRFRKITKCERFSYFRRPQSAPKGVGGHSRNNVIETWVIINHDNGIVQELTDRLTKQYLMRIQPLLYNEYSDRNRRNGTPIDYIRRICEN